MRDMTNAELLAYVDDLQERLDAEAGVGKKTGRKRGVFFTKGTQPDDDEPDAHGRFKAAHHEQMARLYQRVAGQHRSMADHYADAHKDEARKASADDDALEVLKAAGHDVEARLAEAELQRRAVRSCLREPQVSDPSRAGFDKVRRSE